MSAITYKMFIGSELFSARGNLIVMKSILYEDVDHIYIKTVFHLHLSQTPNGAINCFNHLDFLTKQLFVCLHQT